MSILSRPRTRAGRILKHCFVPKALWDDASPSSRVFFYALFTATALTNMHRQNQLGAANREVIGQNEIIVRQQALITTLQRHLAAATD